MTLRTRPRRKRSRGSGTVCSVGGSHRRRAARCRPRRRRSEFYRLQLTLLNGRIPLASQLRRASARMGRSRLRKKISADEPPAVAAVLLEGAGIAVWVIVRGSSEAPLPRAVAVLHPPHGVRLRAGPLANIGCGASLCARRLVGAASLITRATRPKRGTAPTNCAALKPPTESSIHNAGSLPTASTLLLPGPRRMKPPSNWTRADAARLRCVAAVHPDARRAWGEGRCVPWSSREAAKELRARTDAGVAMPRSAHAVVLGLAVLDGGCAPPARGRRRQSALRSRLPVALLGRTGERRRRSPPARPRHPLPDKS